jgi:hypothetical protein
MMAKMPEQMVKSALLSLVDAPVGMWCWLPREYIKVDEELNCYLEPLGLVRVRTTRKPGRGEEFIDYDPVFAMRMAGAGRVTVHEDGFRLELMYAGNRVFERERFNAADYLPVTEVILLEPDQVDAERFALEYEVECVKEVFNGS